MALPLSVRWSRWSLEVTDDHSPFSTHEHDPGLRRQLRPPLLGAVHRREPAGRVGTLRVHRPGPLQGLGRRLCGRTRRRPCIPEFLAHRESPTRPTVLGQHPDAEFLKKWYLFSGQTADAVAHAQRVIDGLKKPYGENNFFLVGLSNYRKSQFLAFVDLAEDALACPQLPTQEVQQELRRLLALYANVLSDPDLNPHGAGVHLGNNNMTINRTLALSYFAGLLPDHPRYAYWMEAIRDFVQYKFSTEMSVDGVENKDTELCVVQSLPDAEYLAEYPAQSRFPRFRPPTDITPSSCVG